MSNDKPDYAGIIIRAFAVVIDAAILLPITGLLHGLFTDHLFMQVLVNLVVSASYYVMFLTGPWQATPGKRIAGIYVINEDGSRLNQKEALARYIAYIMPSLPIYSSFDINTTSVVMLWLSVIWFMPVALTQARTGVHDLLCKTRVLHGKPTD